MEQKDYLLREIEKIGAVMRAILNILTGTADIEAIKLEKQFEQTKELLSDETGLNLDEFLGLNVSETKEYIRNYKGMNSENLELLAEILFRVGVKNESVTDKELLTKALHLFEICNETDHTYSTFRENKIKLIKSLLPNIKSQNL